MKILFDTSVLVAAILERHIRNGAALPWLRRAKAREFGFLVASHTLAELYSVLTAHPAQPRIAPSAAWQLIQENVAAHAQVMVLAPSDYVAVIEELARAGLPGGVVFDALVVRAAQNARADHILTLNPAHFRRFFPANDAYVLVP